MGLAIRGATKLLRNKEIRIYLTFLVSVLIIGSCAAFFIEFMAGVITFAALFLMIVSSFLFTKWRYQQLAELSKYLKQIAGGEYALDIRDNDEGELSILKSEIYKVTVTLSEQAELLKKDKLFLVDAISDISHQLKTPITSMFVMTDLISDHSLPQGKRVEFTQNIRSQLERLQWLVSSLLKLSKIDAGAIEFKKEPVHVKALINKSIEHLLIPMEIKEQTLEISGDEQTQFMGDFNWSSEAVTNIIKNCIEHTPCGGKVGINFSETPIYIIIQIFDNGGGIHQDDLPHIFNRFYKGKNASNHSIGIGLAMAKSILQNQGGIIEVTSEPGQGTQFTLKIHKSVV
ncbi:MAG: sensor histidine kinase [Thermincolia bacterium]